MIKMFASDLDGTLLNYFHQADCVVRAAVREVVASGGARGACDGQAGAFRRGSGLR